MAANHTQCSTFEQRSVIRFMLAEKCKSCEIYRRMSDVYGETLFSQRNIQKCVKQGFATKSLSQKHSSRSEKKH